MMPKILIEFNSDLYLVRSCSDTGLDVDDLLSQVNQGRWPDESYAYSDIQNNMTRIAAFNDEAELL